MFKNNHFLSIFFTVLALCLVTATSGNSTDRQSKKAEMQKKKKQKKFAPSKIPYTKDDIINELIGSGNRPGDCSDGPDGGDRSIHLSRRSYASGWPRDGRRPCRPVIQKQVPVKKQRKGSYSRKR